MIDEFILRAILAGIGVALIAGPLGSFVVWRRMAYFGDALAHSALLGIALGFLLAIHPVLGVLVAGSVLAIAFTFLQGQQRFAADTILGLLAHSALALGLVALGLMEDIRIDLLGYLFGDVLAVSWTDVAFIYAGSLTGLILLAVLWRRLLAVTVNAELAQADGIDPFWIRLAFSFLLAIAVAISMRVVGVLLITSLLLIPAAAARRVSGTPEMMGAVAAGLGCLAVLLGLGGSFQLDTASGPSIVVAAMLLFLLVNLAATLVRSARKPS